MTDDVHLEELAEAVSAGDQSVATLVIIQKLLVAIASRDAAITRLTQERDAAAKLERERWESGKKLLSEI